MHPAIDTPKTTAEMKYTAIKPTEVKPFKYQYIFDHVKSHDPNYLVSSKAEESGTIPDGPNLKHIVEQNSEGYIHGKILQLPLGLEILKKLPKKFITPLHEYEGRLDKDLQQYL